MCWFLADRAAHAAEGGQHPGSIERRGAAADPRALSVVLLPNRMTRRTLCRVCLPVALMAACLAAACGQPQSDARDTWIDVYSQDALPAAVQRKLHVGRDAEAGIANPGEPFEPTDAISDRRLPSSRLVAAARKNDGWLVVIERGGFAYGVQVLWFPSADSEPHRLATLDKPPRSLDEVRPLVPR